MYGLVFGAQAPPVVSDANRVDIACFVGFVQRRTTHLPEVIRCWLYENGWAAPPYARPDLEALLDIPVPIDSWDMFDALFEWETRPLDNLNHTATSYVGAAVRSFFTQGGRKCYMVRVDDPWEFTASYDTRRSRIHKLLPGYPHGLEVSPVDRQTWHGVGHLFGLPDVSFLCLPDLPDALGVRRQMTLPPPLVTALLERFVECSDNEPAAPVDRAGDDFRAPRCDEQGYADWARAMHLLADLLQRRQREVQLVAALPLPATAPDIVRSSAERDLLAFLTSAAFAPLSYTPEQSNTGLASAFVQLAYPWLRTRGSENLPEQLESPDGVLVGMLARNAMTRGTFRSIANTSPTDVYAVSPVLGREHLFRRHVDKPVGVAASHSLLERVSLFGPTPRGLALLSDVTTSLQEIYRPASVNRLVAAIVGAARRVGEEAVFEASGPSLWGQLKERLETLLVGLLQAGALHGTTAAEAFEVRCDLTTMSQHDLDSGRVITHIQFNAALPIDTITVMLALQADGQVALLATKDAA
jgi:hypothetical protein